MSLRPARERLRERKELLQTVAKKSLGQNFLISDHVIQKILQATQRLKAESLIEIGPGLGALTDGLKLLGPPIDLIELDREFAQYWLEQGQKVHQVDALQWDWDLQSFRRPCVLVSNLPYQISSSLVVDRSLDEKPLDGMILMFQKEVAQRIRADLKHELYGFLSVLAQTFWKIETVVDAAPGDFSPAPKVASRVLLFLPKPSPVADRREYLRFLKACFLQPRKLLVSNLAQGWGSLRKEEWAQRLETVKLDPQVRADQLSVQKFLELFATRQA